MRPDDIRFSVPAVWFRFYSELCGTQWNDDDLDYVVYRKNHGAQAAAGALRHVYQMDWLDLEPEDGVRATLKAAVQFHEGTFLTPAQVKEMARHFAVHHRDKLAPMKDYLDKHCAPVGWHWLNEHGRHQVERAVVKDSQIWVTDVNVSDDVWIFNKPEHGT